MRGKLRALLNGLRTHYRNNPKQARTAGAVLVVLAFLSFGALKFTSAPRFCYWCHEIKPAYQAWQQSIHAGVTCTDCHVPSGTINATARRVKAAREAFLHFKGFNKPKIQGTERELVNEACGRCHSFNREMAFGAGLRVPHTKHIEEGLMCTTCHLRVVHGEGDEKSRKPKMDTCMKCHNGERAPEGCGVCHITLAITEEKK